MTRRESPPESATPTEISPPREASEPVRVISMKMPDAVERSGEQARKQFQPKLRSLDEVGRRTHTPAGGLGYLAPPRDPRAARTRRWRDYAAWGAIAVILGASVTFGIWLLAGG